MVSFFPAIIKRRVIAYPTLLRYNKGNGINRGMPVKSARKEGNSMTIQPEKIGAYIAALRKAKQMTQTELGQRLQISSQAVSKWERGGSLR